MKRVCIVAVLALIAAVAVAGYEKKEAALADKAEAERLAAAEEAKRKAQNEREEMVGLAREYFENEVNYECVKAYYEAWKMGYAISGDDAKKFERAYANENKRLKELISYYHNALKLGRSIGDLESIEKKRAEIIKWHRAVKAEAELDRKVAAEAEAKRKAAEEETKRKFAEEEAKRKAREAEVREKVNLARELFEIEAYYDCVKAYYEAWQMGYAISGDDADKFENAYTKKNKDLKGQIDRGKKDLNLGRTVDNLRDLEKTQAEIIKWYKAVKGL